MSHPKTTSDLNCSVLPTFTSNVASLCPADDHGVFSVILRCLIIQDKTSPHQDLTTKFLRKFLGTLLLSFFMLLYFMVHIFTPSSS